MGDQWLELRRQLLMCVCVYVFTNFAHNRATRPCQTNLPMLHEWIRPMGDQWLELRFPLRFVNNIWPVGLLWDVFRLYAVTVF